jgi:hypothetical protein
MFDKLKNRSKSISDDYEIIEKEVTPSAAKQNKGPSSSLQPDHSNNSYPEPPDYPTSTEDDDPSNDRDEELGSNTLKLIHISEMLKISIKTNWLIEGCLTESSLAFMFGNPANGKSFIALDMAFCIANGIDWHGHPVKQGTSIYVAGEGYAGLQKRIQGLCIKYDIHAPSNFYISNQAIDLNCPDSMNELVDTLPGDSNIELIIIDTLNRNCSADENSAREMSKVVRNCDILKNYTGASILVIHHSGHSAEGRGRGSSSIKGAIDIEFMVSKKDNEITLKNSKMKDFVEFEPLSFELESVVVGETDDGELISSAILNSKPFTSEAPGCSDKDIKLLDSLCSLIASQGLTVSASDEFYDADKKLVNVDTSSKKISRKDWLAHCQDDIEVKSKTNPDEAKRKSFDRSVRKLLLGDKVAITDNTCLMIQLSNRNFCHLKSWVE